MSHDPDRDREERGRARNARPRDQLGRPLPRGSTGIPPWPEDTSLSPGESLTTAQDLLERGSPFQAHEVLEAAWKTAPEPERALWQALAQLAVAVTHAARGNRRGAAALLERGRAALEPYRDTAPHLIDVPGLLSWASACLQRLSASHGGPVDLRWVGKVHVTLVRRPLGRHPQPQPAIVTEEAEGSGETADPIGVISRWELFGGAWRVIARAGEQVTISLCRCDGAEEQQRLISTDPALIGWLGDRTRSTPTSTGPPR